MAKIHQYLALTILIICQTIGVQAQNWEYGFMVGASNYHGDLAYNIVPNETHLAQGMPTCVTISRLTGRTSLRKLHMPTISGSDANFDDYKYRNLSFESEIWEFNNVFEFNFATIWIEES